MSSVEINFPPFRLDFVNRQVWRGTERLALRPQALRVLHYLLEHRQELISQERLLEACWVHAQVSETALKVCVREIRIALGDTLRRPLFIKMVHRRGYKFIGTLPVPYRARSYASAATCAGTTRAKAARLYPPSRHETTRPLASSFSRRVICT